jgi:hypothetical protein
VQVQLTYPFGRGSEIRAAAEGEPNRDASQFSRDARSTYEFINSAMRRQQKNGLVVKWVEDLPPSLLIWTEEYALVELYDYGRDDKALQGCIGRKAPILVINRKAKYHSLLKNSFDYVFNGDPKNTRVKTYTVEQLRKEYAARR